MEKSSLQRGVMMQFVMAVIGKTSEKVFKHQKRQVTPFLGAKPLQGESELGLGLLSDTGEVIDFWQPEFERLLLQGWWALQILENLTHIWENTLKSCWYAAARETGFGFDHHLQSLADQIGWSRFPSWREGILSTQPSEETLKTAVQALQAASIDFDTVEIRRELMACRLTKTRWLDRVLEETSARYRRECAAERAEHEREVRVLAMMPAACEFSF